MRFQERPERGLWSCNRNPYGDINGDGLINDADHTMLLNDAFFGESNITAETVYRIAADMNGDGVLDGFDYFIQDGVISGNRVFDQSVKLYK